MLDVRGDVLRPPHGTTPAAVLELLLPRDRFLILLAVL